MKDVLTPEQYEKFEKALPRNARPGRPPRLLRAEAEGQGNEVIVSDRR